MKRLFLTPLAPILLLFPIAAVQAQDCLELVYADEFDYTGLPDASKWSYDVAGPGWVNNEEQNYVGNRLENSRVENGNLIIEARHDNYQGHPYSSARLNANYKMSFQYGRAEFRAILPGGRGTWPALWLMPTDIFKHATTCTAQTGWTSNCDAWPNSGEIDVMEYVGHDPGNIHGSAHTKNANFQSGGNFTSHIFVENETTEFHTYAMEWTPDQLEFFVDGVSYGLLTRPGDNWEDWPFDQPFYPIINIAIGGSWGGAQGVDQSIFPVQMVVDYVRLYEWKSDNGSTPYLGITRNIPGVIQAEDYDEGCGQNPGYIDTDPGNNGGAYRSDNVDIETNGDITNVGWTETGESLTYSVEVTNTGVYDLQLNTASETAGGNLSLFVDNAKVVDNYQLPVTGGWQTWQLSTIQGLMLSAGAHKVKIEVDAGQFNLDYMEFSDITTSNHESQTAGSYNTLYPIPAGDWVQIPSTTEKVEVFDLTGALLQSVQGSNGRLDVSELRSGLYIVKAGLREYQLVKQ